MAGESSARQDRFISEAIKLCKYDSLNRCGSKAAAAALVLSHGLIE